MAVQSIADAGFYSFVHDVLETESAPEALGERREETRQGFDSVQLIAPYEDGQLPNAGQFHRIKCQDLSPGGMSYLADAIPRCKQMLVLLGPAPFIFLTAEVVHHTPVVTGDQTQHLI